MAEIIVNDKKYPHVENETVQNLLERLQITLRGTAVVINGVVILKSDYTVRTIQPSDNLELINVVGGG